MRKRKDRSKMRQYALYKGDEFVDLGTADYLAGVMGIKSQTVRFLATPTYAKRRTEGCAIVIRIDDEEDNE